VKPTLAQIAAASAAKPVQKNKPPSAARPFVSNTGPSGFQFVYIGRSRKISRGDTRARLKRCGIDISRVLDISFPAHGIIGVLVHCQYAPTFISTMKRVNAELFEDFDPLDPKHIADPQYESCSQAGRQDLAAQLQYKRCMNALTYLQASRPYQVKPVGYSLVQLGYISAEDVTSCASTPATNPRAKVNSDAGALF
ncbi:hypothetical protein BD770DRAFT_309866, partial [Pilaira anomala]